MNDFRIRSERAEDEKEIWELTRRAFDGKPYADGTEPDIPDRLRTAGDLLLSLVAEENDALAGHVAFSPVVVGRSRSFVCLGPLSVLPSYQRRGIGTALVEAGLSSMRRAGYAGCILEGDPNYYKRFGFEVRLDLTHGERRSPYLQSLSFGEKNPFGEVRYHAAFSTD